MWSRRALGGVLRWLASDDAGRYRCASAAPSWSRALLATLTLTLTLILIASSLSTSSVLTIAITS